MVQSRDALCYHLTCRGHRWNKGVGIENPDYESIMTRCRRDFIRKWGDWINNDGYQYPIINPKYDIGFVIKNCNNQLLEALEPWCNRVYSDQTTQELYEYGTVEWLKTSFNIHNRVVPINIEPSNGILVKINGDKFTQQDFQTIQQLSAIIQDSGAIGEFELVNLKIQINDLTTYENKLIKYER